jgi:dihydrofolate reductase
MAMDRRTEMPSISFVVARSSPGHKIGCENKLPWHLKTDLVRFKKITLGHAIIMGRRTHESIGRTLPGRTTIVISRKSTPPESMFWSFQDTALLWAKNRENAIFLADIISIGKGKKDFFVVGGEEIFNMFLGLFNKVYLTEVLADVRGDAVFHHEFKYPYWQKTFEEEFSSSNDDEYPSRFLIYEKRDKTTRFETLPDFFTDAELRREWIDQKLNTLSLERKQSPKNSGPLLFPDI